MLQQKKKITTKVLEQVMGEFNKRKRPYRPASVINVSAMSYGSLSAKAVESLNKGVKMAGAYHNTGEGGLSPYHSNGGDVVFHFGTGYFGVRSEDGGFSMEKMIKLVQDNPFVRAIEIKLSQGAKPGKGGVLPGAKITKEIAEVDGGEGGTGAAPPSFADHVSLPWVYGFGELYKLFKSKGLSERIVFIGSGKLGFPAKAAMAFAKYFKTFRKEFIEITHAAGYEHPCQFKMSDIEMNVDDHSLTKELDKAFMYEKVPVPFRGVQHFKDCMHLGGWYILHNPLNA